MKVRLIPALLCTFGLLSNAHAVVTVDSTTNVAPPVVNDHDPYDPSIDTPGSGPNMTASSIDVVQGFTEAGGGVSTSGNDNYEFSAGVDVTTDGSIATVYNEPGPGGDAVDHATYASVGTGDTLTYTLGGLFDISQIDIYAGWNDSGRDDFSFDLLVSTDIVNYTSIATYTKGPDDTGAITVPITHLHSVTDDGGADIATGIRSIQLQITDADNGVAGLLEFDVFGEQINVPGDANNDTFVDILDFNIISSNFLTTTAVGANGDVTGDGVVDQKDFRLWRVESGADGGNFAAIPEPTSIVIAGMCAVMGLGARRRRS